MIKKGILNLSSLKDQVYEYLRHQMKIGALKPGSIIDMSATSERLGVSKTPLRDALIQLEMEGFVKILPRRGVIVNVLTVQDIKDLYEILGALESVAIISASNSLGEPEVDQMEKLNKAMARAIERDDFNNYYAKNLQFHNIYIDLSGNMILKKTTETLKKRLYDFPRRGAYIKEWEVSSIGEHRKLVGLIAAKKNLEAANFIRDVHWSFKVQEKFIRKYYSDDFEFEGTKRGRILQKDFNIRE